jgi:hypothetical protein
MVQKLINRTLLIQGNQSGIPIYIPVESIYKPIPSTGTAIKFDFLRTYGYDVAETGNITLDSTGGVVEGLTQLLIHNSGSEPTLGAGLTLISGSYTTGVDNYIFLHSVKPDLILVTITQGA